MSRKSDSPSSGQGRGATAYPSGTTPYGTPPQTGDDASGAAAGGKGARPEEPKTETTLTTRVKINIPGSRPIPPVVVRTPVSADDALASPARNRDADAPAPEDRPAARGGDPSAHTGTPGPEAATGPGEGDDRTSDWFAPRKPRPAGQPTGASPTPSERPGAARPAAPGDQAYGARDYPAGGSSPFDAPRQPNPFDGPASPFDAPRPGAAEDDAPREPDPYGPHGGPYGRGDASGRGPAAPKGPTAGPVRGSVPLDLPPGFADPAPRPARNDAPGWGGLATGGGDALRADPAATGVNPLLEGPAATGPAASGPDPLADDPASTAALPVVEDPSATGGHPVAGDDTAVLTPQPSAPGPAGTGSRRRPRGPEAGGRGRSDTLPGGIPAVPGAGAATPGPFGATPAAGATAKPEETAAPKPLPKIPEPINPKKKGRSKLAVLGGGLVVVAGLAYGAGLLLDHADVPSGTTALGVDIGGLSKEEAVKKLDAALGDRPTAPLTLDVAGKTASLRPSKAGLAIDTDATVRHAAGRDYNPVSVIGSLFGRTNAATPDIVVDDEKLGVALKSVVGTSAPDQAGGITFEHGRAVPHYGSTYKSVDVDASRTVVTDAYERRAAGGGNAPVRLAATEHRPAVTRAAVDKAMKDFAQPAMSGLVTVRTDAAHTISFSPEKSIPKFLTMTVVNGRLEPHYDLNALKELYGTTFQGATVQTASGARPVTPQYVSIALNQALRGRTPAERTQTIGNGG